MRDLPQGWAWATVGEVADTQLGKMLSAKARGGADPRPYLRNKSVQWGRFDLSDLPAMDFSDEEFARFRVERGDLLVCEGGEVGRAAIWRGQLPEIAFQKALHRVRPRGGIAPELLLYRLHHLADTHGFDAFVTGSTIKHLPQEDLRLLPLPLPPLNEQRRIVAAIEEQFSRLDAADAFLTVAARRLDALKAASVERLFESDWPLLPLADIAQLAGGVTKDVKKQRDPQAVEVPYLRVANVQRGRLDLRDVATIRVSPEKAAGLALRPGDVLFNEGGDRDKLGRGWVWSGEIPGCIHQNHVFRARLSPEFDPKFVSWHGNTFGRTWFEQNGRQTTNLASISLSTLRRFPVPAIPLDEQRRIVADIEQRLSVIDALAASITAAQKRSAALRRAILDRAFRGELVPQDPADEPASVLLERIRAERAAAPKATPRRRVRSTTS